MTVRVFALECGWLTGPAALHDAAQWATLPASPTSLGGRAAAT